MRTVLAIRLSSMGDVAMTVPVLHAFEEQYPKTHLTILTREAFIPFFGGLNRAEILVADSYLNSGISGLWKLSKKLKTYEDLYVADLHNVLRTQFLKTLSAPKTKAWEALNKNRANKKKLVRKENKTLTPLPSVFSLQLEVFKKIGFPLKLDHKVRSFLKNDSSKINAIGIAPGSRHIQKKLDLNSTKELVSSILNESDREIYLFGGPEEEGELASIQSIDASRIHLTNEYSLGEQLSLMSSLEFLISMDSSNAHMASLAGIPVITIWCATDSRAGFQAFGQQKAHNVQLDELDCRPCSIYGNKDCWRRDLACTQIPSKNIMKKLEPFL